MNNSLFSQRLEESIKRAGIKKSALAKSAGLTPQSLSRYLRSGRPPRQTVVITLAQKLGTTADYLLGTASEPAPLADSPAVSEVDNEYLPDAVALTGLDADERRTMIRMLDALRSGDAEIRRHLIGQLKIIEVALQSRRQQPRAETKDGA